MSTPRATAGLPHGRLQPSLWASLLGWYSRVWKAQEDVVSCIHLSLELWTDKFFCRAQSLLLACMLLLLVGWKAWQRGQQCLLTQLQQSWRELQRRLATVLLLLQTCYWRLESLGTPITWVPAYCITRLTCLTTWLLQAAFEHALQVASRALEGGLEPPAALVPEPHVHGKAATAAVSAQGLE
ncbi:transmembrane protein 270 [Pelodiscus sinensis]|uniref:transmembrane protein 270 n=1 Tax=Pelodiscus sinensis TaxID=13735 RepID=UPI003F6A8E07